jgi:hypothetical protein
MRLAHSLGGLIEKRLIEKQAAFLLSAMRQRFSTCYQPMLADGRLDDASQAANALREMAISVMNEIKNPGEGHRHKLVRGAGEHDAAGLYTKHE